MSAIKAFKKAFKTMTDRNWEFIYVFVDLHDTVLRANYSNDEIPKEYFPYAKESMKILTDRRDVKLIMYTCSHPKEIDEYIKYFAESEIVFDYVNENPEVLTMINGYGCYDKKPYMNLILDDKCGFDGDEDWLPVLEYLKTL